MNRREWRIYFVATYGFVVGEIGGRINGPLGSVLVGILGAGLLWLIPWASDTPTTPEEGSR